ncbi:MAG TPA: MMPL family transporter [Intrasporangium sp.]|uniref:MMPL family transporter n=1 Tax=Intrasporangium sp. TaxID=1925024 RepID=UPI002D773360|nr:MMPL family transporter [Intrasporangium sp.]HET7399517.1 MMPL family transporter [Intrasporangium sp.]
MPAAPTSDPSARRTTLSRLGGAIGRHPVSWIAGWLVLAVAAFAVAVGGVTGESLFDRLQSGEPSVEGQSQQARAIIAAMQPRGESLLLQVDGAPLTDAAAVRAAAAATARVGSVPGVAAVRSPLLAPGGLTDPAVAPLLAGGSPAAGRFATVVEFDKDLDGQAQEAATAAAEQGLDEVVRALPGATGSFGSTDRVVSAITGTVERDLVRGEGIALPLTFVVMLFIFGGLVAAGLPIVGAVVAIGGALLALFGFSHLLGLDATVVNIVTLLGLGLSIDYGLLTVSRFREELAVPRGHRSLRRADVVAATERTLATAGRTVLFSGVTVAIALSGLLVFEAEIMKAIGLAGVSVVLVAMLVAVTLVPALAVLGARRLARRGPGRETDEGAFSALARSVQRRPVAVIAVVAAALVALALPTLSMRLASSGTHLLPVEAQQRVFFDRLATDYPALSSPDVMVVARSEDTAAVTSWAADLDSMAGVSSVAVRPLGTAYQLVSVAVDGQPSSDDAQRVVTHVRESGAPFQTWVTGEAAGQIDFLASMNHGAPYAVGLVVLGTVVLLFLMTGSLVIPAKALLLNVISLGAALGVVVWVFEDGHLQRLLGFSSVGAVESMVPFLVLAFGFGLSMDYEVFLLSRIAEFHSSGVPNDRAVALGLQRTGRIITSAALLIVIVFAGFVVGDILIIKEMGVALVSAILIDATLVRMLLVPATMTLLGRWNWWAPGPLRRLHARFGIAE